MGVVMNLSIKNIFLLIGLLSAAQLDGMTPEDVQARKERVEGQLGQLRSNSAEVEKQSGDSVLGKRERRARDDKPNSKKPKYEGKQEEEKNEVPVAIQPADPNQMCGLASLPAEVLSMIAGKLDFSSYASLSKTCRYLDSFLNDEREIENFIKQEIRARGHKNITGPLCSYFSECMNLFGVQPRNLQENNNLIHSVIELRDGNLASCPNDGTIKIWNPDSGDCLRMLVGHTRPVNSVIELRDGNLASCSDDRTIKIWNPERGECLRTLKMHTNPPTSVIELRDGNLASCSGDRTIKFWNPESGEFLRTLKMHTSWATSVVELSDGNLASCSGDRTIKVWNQSTGECLHTLAGHTSWIRSVIELSDGNLASCSADRAIKIWNSNTGECLRTLEEHTDEVESVIELSNGNLASCSRDTTIKIWNQSTGECLHTLAGHTTWIRSVIELRNGNLASCCLWGDPITIWNLYPEDLSAQQIYLVLRLDLCARYNSTIRLDDFWAEIFKSLPDYLKIKYQNVMAILPRVQMMGQFKFGIQSVVNVYARLKEILIGLIQ